MAKRVFVVDDESRIADTLAVILRLAGYDAQAFYNAQTTLEEIALCAPDLVISDIMMPGMNGVDMAVLIRERHPECKVLLLSGNAAMTDMLDKARLQGHIFDFLAKPIHPADLLARMLQYHS